MDVNDWISVRWEKITPEVARYYLAHLHQDLWGEWVLTRVWGGKDSAIGRIVHTPVASRQAGLHAVEQLYKVRRRRAYALVEPTPQ